MKKIIPTLLILGASITAADAVPVLQLDIAGGSYDLATETVVSTNSPFTLYALLKDDGGLVDNTFHLVASIPKSYYDAGTMAGAQFSVDGVPVGFPHSGTPAPIEKHGIFPTVYVDLAFTFNPANKAAEYNSEDSPGGWTPWGGGNDPFLYYRAFTIDMGLFPENTPLHFDLYGWDDAGKQVVAPYSHDGEGSWHDGGGGGGNEVPEGGLTVALLGAALTSLGVLRAGFRRA